MIMVTITNIKRKAKNALRILMFLLILGLVVPAFFGLVSTYITSADAKFKEEHPTGQPMRVEKSTQKAEKRDNSLLDSFVVKLRDFYEHNSD